jgi:hypothetical protein
MALSAEARELLQQLGGFIAGGAVGGQEGAVAGRAAAERAAVRRTERDDLALERADEAAAAEAAARERQQRQTIATQLELLKTPGLTLDSRNQLVTDIAERTGMDPDTLEVTLSRNAKASDLLEVFTNKNVPAAAREDAWRVYAQEYGLNPEVGFESMSSSFDDLTPEEKQEVFLELKDPNVPTQDINRTAVFLANFNGEGKPITSAQLKALGIVTESGLSFGQRVDLLELQQRLGSQLAYKDLVKMVQSIREQATILGRSTLTDEEMRAEMSTLMTNCRS